MSSTLINSQWIPGDSDELISTTPDETKILWQKNASSPYQVKRAVESAQFANLEWTKSCLSDRIDIVQKFAVTLKQREKELANAISLETGKPRWEALTEVMAMVNKVAISIRAQQERAGFLRKSHLSLSHHAHGVMAVLGPFNFPGHLPNGHIVPALLAGNTVVFKPSELTPWVAELTAKIWLDSGLPAGVLNLVQGGRAVGEALVDADVNGILFTGSYNTGKRIHTKLAGRTDILLALEMGGNNPLVVSALGNLDVAANTILHSAFLSAGQRCTCTRRLIVVESESHQALLNKLIHLCRRIVVGPSTSQESFMGPVINSNAANILLTYQQQLIDKGAKVLLKMTPGQSSVYLSPGILDVTGISVEDKECFGPLLQLYLAKDFSHAMEMANSTQFGLAAGLISDSPTEHEAFKQQMKAGIISINSPTAGASSELPFGGIGASGNHRPSAYYAADYCAWPQAITVGEKTSTQAEKLDINTIRGLQ